MPGSRPWSVRRAWSARRAWSVRLALPLVALVVTGGLVGSVVTHAARPDRPASHARPAAATAPIDPGPPGDRPRGPGEAERVEADLFVTTPGPLPAGTIDAIRAAPGVRSLTLLDVGTVGIRGARASVIGVDSAQFRRWAPQPSAQSDPLWQSIGRGELTVSHDLGTQLGLPLGGTEAVRVGADGKAVPLRIGAYASMGLPGVDATVARSRSAALGLTPAAGALVGTSGGGTADLARLRNLLVQQGGPGTQVQLLRPLAQVGAAVPTGSSDGSLTTPQAQLVLAAARSRLGAPYVWGAAGPDSFDCSGLVGWAFQAAGVSLPRTAAQQALTGPRVELPSARPGDLLVWANDPSAPDFVDHIGIYAGDGQMIVAPHTGDVVKVAAVPTGPTFRGVIRVQPVVAAAIGGPRF